MADWEMQPSIQIKEFRIHSFVQYEDIRYAEYISHVLLQLIPALNPGPCNRNSDILYLLRQHKLKLCRILGMLDMYRCNELLPNLLPTSQTAMCRAWSLKRWLCIHLNGLQHRCDQHSHKKAVIHLNSFKNIHQVSLYLAGRFAMKTWRSGWLVRVGAMGMRHEFAPSSHAKS